MTNLTSQARVQPGTGVHIDKCGSRYKVEYLSFGKHLHFSPWSSTEKHNVLLVSGIAVKVFTVDLSANSYVKTHYLPSSPL